MSRVVASLRVLALFVAIGAPAAARAEEPENGQPTLGAAVAEQQSPEAAEAPKLDVGRLGLQILNFAVLVGVLVFFGGKAINKALLARHEQLKADLAEASAARAAAEARAAEQEKRLASLETEIAGIRAGIEQEAEAERDRLVAAAEERAKRIGEETKFLLDQQVKQAEAALKREVAEAAVKIAEQLVTKSLGQNDQQRLVDSFVTDVGAPSAARRTS
ncbi:MAG TPA: ATP synthase F0 subunit B [Polyangia bacterium]|nr:ATP synthase F0 subunit B [Polyangia bacterium]